MIIYSNYKYVKHLPSMAGISSGAISESSLHMQNTNITAVISTNIMIANHNFFFIFPFIGIFPSVNLPYSCVIFNIKRLPCPELAFQYRFPPRSSI